MSLPPPRRKTATHTSHRSTMECVRHPIQDTVLEEPPGNTTQPHEAPSPFLHVVDGQRNAPAAVQGRCDVDGVEALGLPHVLHRPQEVAQNLAGQHLLHVHVSDVKLGLVGQRELCGETRGAVSAVVPATALFPPLFRRFRPSPSVAMMFITRLWRAVSKVRRL